MGLAEENRREVSSPSAQHIIIGGYMLSICLFTDGVKCAHLVKVVFARFLHCQVTIFSRGRDLCSTSQRDAIYLEFFEFFFKKDSSPLS